MTKETKSTTKRKPVKKFSIALIDDLKDVEKRLSKAPTLLKQRDFIVEILPTLKKIFDKGYTIEKVADICQNVGIDLSIQDFKRIQKKISES
jgi:hypothetical protein